jgi:hypothetical protein
MKHFFFLFIFLLGSILTSNAQVKIGDNPNTINSNSLLEMESTNKGFLPPRIALNNANSILPLSGSVTAGMLVYSTGGTLIDGYYYWDGAKWVRLTTSATGRSNYVLVKSAADFPAPVTGVITLAAGILYEINGTITLTDKINLNDDCLIGKDRNDDVLLYTGSGELFTGSNGGNIVNLGLSATGGGSKLFNLDGLGAQKNVIVEFGLLVNNVNLGLIKNFAGTVAFQTCVFMNNANGITLQDLGDFVGNNEIWFPNNSNTFQTFVGTFNTILMVGGKFDPMSAFSATALNVFGITSITGGAQLKAILFVGTGIYVTGTFANQWEVECTGITTERDGVAAGNIYLTTSALTTFSLVNTPTKVLGTTTAVGLFRVTSPSNNRIVYSGLKTRRFETICSLSLTASANNKTFSFYIAKNGVLLPESKQTLKLGTGVATGSITLSCTVQLAPSDYIEVWAENNTDATGLTVETFNLAVK